MKRLVSLALSAASLAAVLGGCGGESSRHAQYYYGKNPLKSGTFIDAFVSGLEYNSSLGNAGVTDENGTFLYRNGEFLTFTVGRLALGTALASSIITPRAFYYFDHRGSLSDTPVSVETQEISNRVRLMLALDEDPNTIGIQISGQTRAEALQWETPEYNASESAFVQAVREATDGMITALPSAAVANEHFSRSLRCIYSGGYKGEWDTGDPQKPGGFVGVMIQADGTIVAMGDGQQVGTQPDTVIYTIGEHNISSERYRFDGSNWYFNRKTGAIEEAGLKISGYGVSVGFDRVEGTFVNEGQEGHYSALRIGSVPDAAFRYTGYGYMSQDPNQPVGMFIMDVDANGSVSGLIHDARTDEEPRLHGRIDPKTGVADLKLQDALGTVLSGRVDFDDPAGGLQLQWSNDQGRGTVKGVGCQLRPLLR